MSRIWASNPPKLPKKGDFDTQVSKSDTLTLRLFDSDTF